MPNWFDGTNRGNLWIDGQLVNSWGGVAPVFCFWDNQQPGIRASEPLQVLQGQGFFAPAADAVAAAVVFNKPMIAQQAVNRSNTF